MDTARIIDKSRIMDTASTMVIKDHGHSKDHGNNEKENNKEYAQPPKVGERSRLILHNVFLYFHKNTQPPLTSCNSKRDRAIVIGSVIKR